MNISDITRLTCLSLVFVTVSGCASHDSSPRVFKGYEDLEVPTSELATLKLGRGLILVGVNDIKPRKPISGAMVSLRAGTQVLKVGSSTLEYRRVTQCAEGGTLSESLRVITKLGGYRLIEFDVAAGHQYTVYSEFVASIDGNPSSAAISTSTDKQASYTWKTKVIDNTERRPVESKTNDVKLHGIRCPR